MGKGKLGRSMTLRPANTHSQTRPYELLVFDWDGTLMDSVASIVACMQATTRHLGLDPIPESRIRESVGLGLDDTFDALVPGADAALRGRILDSYRQLWLTVYRHRPEPFLGIGLLLEGLAADGYLLAVATGKGRRGLDLDLKNTGFSRFFQATRTADEAFPKPHPQMLHDLLEELGVRPEGALVIGDTAYDLEMAAHAGVAALAVTGGSHPRERLEALSPLAILPGAVGLKRWLDEEPGRQARPRAS